MLKVIELLKAAKDTMWKLSVDQGEARPYHTMKYVDDQRKHYDTVMDEIEIAVEALNEFDKRARDFRGLLNSIEATTGGVNVQNIIDEFDEFVNLDSYKLPESPARKRET